MKPSKPRKHQEVHFKGVVVDHKVDQAILSSRRQIQIDVECEEGFKPHTQELVHHAKVHAKLRRIHHPYKGVCNHTRVTPSSRCGTLIMHPKKQKHGPCQHVEYWAQSKQDHRHAVLQPKEREKSLIEVAAREEFESRAVYLVVRSVVAEDDVVVLANWIFFDSHWPPSSYGVPGRDLVARHPLVIRGMKMIECYGEGGMLQKKGIA